MSSINDFLSKHTLFFFSNRIDLELLLAHALKKNREFILAHPEMKLTKKQEAFLLKMIARRKKYESIAHILGKKDFCDLTFKVNRHTLIPRPETELLVSESEKKINAQKLNTIIDIGTGSGNIVITIAKHLKNKKINYFGIDISQKALNVAKSNAKKYNLDKKIKFIAGNLLTPFNKKNFSRKAKTFIIANLPYLSQKIYSACAPDVKNYEPKSALYSSQAGLNHYEKLFRQIVLLQTQLGIKNILIEFSPEQKKKLAFLVKNFFPHAQTQFKKDLAKKWRICTIELEK
jgi:release factor glutamine methyltransferase